jgi:hypothetical protein
MTAIPCFIFKKQVNDKIFYYPEMKYVAKVYYLYILKKEIYNPNWNGNNKMTYTSLWKCLHITGLEDKIH